jgi:hypothetical protein
MSPAPGKPGGAIEIEVRRARIRVEPGVELATLSTVLSALRGIRDRLRPYLKVVLAAQPVDFRKSVHTPSALVSEALRTNPYCGHVFVFRSKRADGVKLLAWDGAAWCW